MRICEILTEADWDPVKFSQDRAGAEHAFQQQVDQARRTMAAQSDWAKRLNQQQIANPRVLDNPAQATNAALAQKRGFKNVGEWYQDIMTRLGDPDPKIYEPAQRDLDQYEANLRRDARHVQPGKQTAWRHQAQQKVRRDYRQVGPYPVVA